MLPDQTEEEDRYLKPKDQLKNSLLVLVEDAERLSKKLVYYSGFISRYQKLSLSVVALSVVSKRFMDLYNRKCCLSILDHPN